jgi:KaiC/GvpD/RAD55 family RecA-like ATPase
LRVTGSIVDNVIVLRCAEVEGRLERAAFVLKARGIGHTTELRRFVIDDRAAHVGKRFQDLRAAC